MFGIHTLPVENAGPNQAALGNSSLAPTYANSFAPEVGPLKSSSELFSTPAAAAFLPQKNEAAVSRMNEFKQLLDIKTSGAGMTEFKQLFDTRPSGAGIAGGLGSSPALVRPSDFATPSASIWRPSAAPVSGLNSLSGPSVAAPLGGLPGSSLNTATLPGSQAPKFTTPPAGFQLPKRSF
jgi:hypothetical protein